MRPSALLGARAAASRRDGLPLPTLVAALPPGLLVHRLAAVVEFHELLTLFDREAMLQRGKCAE